jgi:hypothetical protein
MYPHYPPLAPRSMQVMPVGTLCLEIDMQTAQTFNNQRELDRALPAEDRPARNLDSEVNDLMCGYDTEFLSYAAFADEIEERLFTLVPDRSVVDLYLTASRSSDSVVKGKAEDAREKFEVVAKLLMQRAIDKQEKRIGGRP